MTSAVSSPDVAGDQGVACAKNVAEAGSVICTLVPICSHPIPNSPHDSVCTFAAPMRCN